MHSQSVKGFRSGWHFCQIFGSDWPLVRCTPNQWGFRSGWHFCQICWSANIGQMHPQSVRGFRSGWHFCQICWSGWHWSDALPISERLQVRLTFLSDFWVRLTFGQMHPQSVRFQVRLTFLSDLLVRLTLVRCTPNQWEASGQVDIFVRSVGQANIGQMHPQSVRGFRSGWHFCQICWSGWHWSDAPPISERLQVRLTFLSDLWVRLTFGQMYPLAEAPGCQVWHYCTFVSGWPVVRCTPTMGRDILWPSVSLLQVRLICLFEGKSGASSHSNSSSMSGY